ncbi:hypothetical protein Tco_0802782 [Tanacetum coccineum]|uniref:Uncharacterized protein n=1 Tax=Tanacetum coccineum TaxID=301880 RepID=A0ABQ4ZZT0_9ASTR
MISYLTRKISRRFTTLYYTLPPNNTLSGLKQIKNDYDTNVMYDIAKVAGKIQLFVSHHQIDLSTVLIPNDGSLEEAFAAHYKLLYIDHLGVDFIIAKYIFPNASLAEMMKYVITNYTSDSEDNKREVTQNDYTFNQMVEWAEQEHFEDEETKLSCPKTDFSTVKCPYETQEALDEEAILEEQILTLMHRFADRFTDRRVEINNLMVLHDHPLIDYGKYALGCMTGADMKKCVHLKSVRDELLRSMEEKRQLMTNYRDM